MNIAINKIVFDRKLLLIENSERTERQPLTFSGVEETPL